MEYSSAATYEVSAVCNVVAGKLPYFFKFWKETWWEWRLGINTGTLYAFVTFRHLGAELFCAKERKMGVLILFRVFYLTKGPKRGPKAPRGG